MPPTNRPLSPHLQIYRPQLTSVLSITHRATGVFLSAASLLLVVWLMALADGPDAFATIQTHLTAWYGRIFMLATSFSLFYHLCNGIRHLFWDIGKGFELETAYKSGWAVVILSVLLTSITWFFAVCTQG
jgi:succinate dehydrogenase / fumarate reductase cytochrome b subunit